MMMPGALTHSTGCISQQTWWPDHTLHPAKQQPSRGSQGPQEIAPEVLWGP